MINNFSNALGKGYQVFFSTWFSTNYVSFSNERTCGRSCHCSRHGYCLRQYLHWQYVVLRCTWSAASKEHLAIFNGWQLARFPSKFTALLTIKQNLVILVVSWPTNSIFRLYKRRYHGFVTDIRSQHLRWKYRGFSWVAQLSAVSCGRKLDDGQTFQQN